MWLEWGTYNESTLRDVLLFSEGLKVEKSVAFGQSFFYWHSKYNPLILSL